MIEHIIFALWFFLPAGVANVTPILVAKAPLLRDWNTPIDFGKSWRGARILGDHKTWRGLVCGVIAGTVVVILQPIIWDASYFGSSILALLALGAALSLGALAGDALKSFFKRRMSVPSGKSWFPFDQLDYIAGGLLLSLPIVSLTFSQYVSVILTWFGMHLLFSYLGYLSHFKKDPI